MTFCNHHPSARRNRPSQRGSALIIGMLILLVLTVIGVTAMNVNMMEEKMAGNFRDMSLAFAAAETALRDGEADVASRVSGLTGFDTSCTNGLCDATGGLSNVWEDATTSTNGVTLGTYTSNPQVVGVACQPQYWIEGFRIWGQGAASWKTRYRITAVACGGHATTKVILQSVYGLY